MRLTTKTIHAVTLGDLVAAAFDRAQRTSDLPIVAREIAARDLEGRLRRSDRADLIRMMVLADRESQTSAPAVAGPSPRASAARGPRQDGRVAIAAVG